MDKNSPIYKGARMGAETTVEHLMLALNEEGPLACITLLRQMDDMFKAGKYDEMMTIANRG
jgi:hypothetical protein